MEFYKEGKILGLTAGQRLDLGASVHNHKGALLFWNGTGAKLEFYTQGTVSLGVTYGTGAVNYTTGAQYSIIQSLIPVRLAGVTPDTIGTTGRIILLN